MYFQREYHCVLLLVLTLCAAVVTSQLSQACTEARAALLADQVCLAATNDAESVLTRGAAISNEALDNFCSSNCRALNNRLATACANQPSDSFDGDTVDLVCTTNGSGSCARFLASQEVANITDAFGSSGECESLANEQTCSSGCATLFQDFINAGGCCAVAVIELGSQITGLGLSADQLILSDCSINPPQGTSCQVLGGGSGGAKELKAYGNLLLFAVIMVHGYVLNIFVCIN